jgi:catechol 2,3-dioxygenase-like lactoylglutathione lyase family enzyme
MRWNHAGIKSSDVERSLYFYCEILGLKKLETITILEKNYFFVGNENISIEIEAGNAGDQQAVPKAMTGLYHMALTVDDLDFLAEKLREHGVNFIIPPVQLRPDRKICFIEDPDGVYIQLIQYLEE